MKMLPVVDGDKGADIYGYCYTPENARTIAEASFADEIDHVERYGPINLASGKTLDEAFVVFTKSWSKQ